MENGTESNIVIGRTAKTDILTSFLSFFNRCGLLKRRFFVPLLTSEVLNTQHVNKTDNYNLFHVIEKNFHCLTWFRDSLSQYVTYFTVTKVHTYLVDITHFIIQ